MTDTRDRIRATVETTPGIHFSELVRQSGFAPGQVQYHIRRLQKAEELVVEACYGQTHYFPPEFEEGDRRAIALLRRETTRAIVDVLFSHPSGLHPDTLASELDLARSTIEYHLDRLESEDLVEKRETLQGGMQVRLRDRDAVAAFRDVTRPSLSARVVDRFERLVDQLDEI